MIPNPQPTVEKPLTAVDYIAALGKCRTQLAVRIYSASLPSHIREDGRFKRAVAARLAAIVESK